MGWLILELLIDHSWENAQTSVWILEVRLAHPHDRKSKASKHTVQEQCFKIINLRSSCPAHTSNCEHRVTCNYYNCLNSHLAPDHNLKCSPLRRHHGVHKNIRPSPQGTPKQKSAFALAIAIRISNHEHHTPHYGHSLSRKDLRNINSRINPTSYYWFSAVPQSLLLLRQNRKLHVFQQRTHRMLKSTIYKYLKPNTWAHKLRASTSIKTSLSQELR